jgi:hypothetical protein
MAEPKWNGAKEKPARREPAARAITLLFRPELQRSFFLNPVKDVIQNVIRITGPHSHGT